MPMWRQGRQGDRRLETGGRGLETGGQETGDRGDRGDRGWIKTVWVRYLSLYFQLYIAAEVCWWINRLAVSLSLRFWCTFCRNALKVSNCKVSVWAKSIKQLTPSYNPLYINRNMQRESILNNLKWNKTAVVSLFEWCVWETARGFRELKFYSRSGFLGKILLFSIFHQNYSQNLTFSCQWRDVNKPHQTEEERLESNKGLEMKSSLQ